MTGSEASESVIEVFLGLVVRQMSYKPSGLLQLHKVVEDYMVLTSSPLGL